MLRAVLAVVFTALFLGSLASFASARPMPLATSTPSPTPTQSPTATPTPPSGPTRTLQWRPGWHNETWSGASTPEEAFACAAGKFAAAYRFTDTGLERYFPDRPEISNMSPLDQYDVFLILITQPVTCVMPATAVAGPTRTLQWDPGWHNEACSGADGAAPQDAFACAAGNYAAAYRFTDAGLERYFPNRPDISNMGPLNKYDAFLILVSAPVTCAMSIAPVTGLLTYDSPDYGIRIEYPADWTKQEQVMGTVVAFFAPREGASDVLQENVNILVQDLSAQPMTLDEFTELSVEQTEQLITDASILDSSAATLGGNPGHKLVFTGKQGQYDLKWLQVWTIKNDKAYVISYTAEIDSYSVFLNTVEEMIESFEIT